ncbi:MAG: hypothetical protein NTNFB02_23110 [Nitrospira sp.]
MKSFSLSNAKWLVAPLIILAGIGAMWSYYALIHVPSQVEYFSGRNLRILATIGNEITSVIRNYNQVQLRTEPREYTIKHTFIRSGTGTSWTITYTSTDSGTPIKKRDVNNVNFERSEFDIVLFVDQNGNVLYQQAPVGIQIGRFDRLIGSRSVGAENKQDTDKKQEESKTATSEASGDTGDTSEASSRGGSTASADASDVKDVTIAGQSYKLFLLPMLVPVQIQEGGTPDPGEGRWVIAGLVKTSRFLSECRAISYTVRSVVICLIIVVLVSTPIIGVLTLGRRERVRGFNVVMLAYSLLMGTGLLTLFLSDVVAYASAERHLNDETRRLAKEIANNVQEEIHRAYRQLHLLTKRAEPDLEAARIQEVKDEKEANRLGIRKNILDTKTNWIIKEPYPFLRMAFWIEPNGYQGVKWFAQSAPTPFLSVSERSYFQHVKEDQLWTIPLVEEKTESPARLWVEPIYSWTTAENSTVLAIPVSPVLPGFESWAAALETKFLSLINPVLPKGFGYAVIDGTGKVLFHSDERRNLRESFIEETDHNRRIQAALAGRSEQEGDGLYWGHDHHFVVKPLERLPWTLVVFRDKELLRTADAEGLATAGLMLLLYVLIMSALFSVSWVFCCLRRSPHKYRATWLWLRLDKHQAYRRTLFFNIEMSLVLVMVILWGSPSLTTAAGALVPIVAVGFGVFQWQRRSHSGRKVTNAGEVLYQAAAVSFVVVLGVLPALAFFRVAYEVEHDLFLKQGQASLAAGLLDREQRVRKDYEKVNLPGDLKQEFFRRRLAEFSGENYLDIYHRFFANTQIEYVDDNSIPKIHPTRNEGQLRWLLETIRIPFNNLATESSGLMGAGSGDGLFTWESPSGAQLDLYYRPVERPQAAHHVIKLSSNRLVLLNKDTLLEVALAIALLGCNIFLIVSLIGRTVFASHVPAASGYKTGQRGDEPYAGSYSGNVLILGSRPPHRALRASSHIIDLGSVMVDDAWIDSVRADIAKVHGTPVAFRNWESHMDDPLRNQQKLQFLRDLQAEGRSLVIQSRTDPTQFELSDEAGRHTETQWLHALRSFSRVYPDDDPGDSAAFEKLVDDKEQEALRELNVTSQEEKRKAQMVIGTACRILRDECSPTYRLQAIGSGIVQLLDFSRVSSGEVREAISRAATGYYHQLWTTCSRGEQYVLFALAKDGFILSIQSDVRNLLRRGLIERKPMLVPFNTTFRQWILDEGSDPSYAKAWTKGEPQRTWVKARHVMVALLAALALFLYATQQEQVNYIMQFATALFAGIPILAEWLGQMSSEKTAPTTTT